jgi:hypothetical protein
VIKGLRGAASEAWWWGHRVLPDRVRARGAAGISIRTSVQTRAGDSHRQHRPPSSTRKYPIRAACLSLHASANTGWQLHATQQGSHISLAGPAASLPCRLEACPLAKVARVPPNETWRWRAISLGAEPAMIDLPLICAERCTSARGLRTKRPVNTRIVYTSRRTGRVLSALIPACLKISETATLPVRS